MNLQEGIIVFSSVTTDPHTNSATLLSGSNGAREAQSRHIFTCALASTIGIGLGREYPVLLSGDDRAPPIPFSILVT